MSPKISLSVYTFSHFCVDFACFYILFSGIASGAPSSEIVAIAFLLYNAIAFGLQPILGYVCDEKPKLPAAVIGCITVLCGFVLLFNAWAALVISAVGNAWFHIGGGVDSLVGAKGKMSRSGVFVSLGALGVVLGTLAGKNAINVCVPIGLMVVSLFFTLLVFRHYPERLGKKQTSFSIGSSISPVSLVIILCFISIMIRSYAGSIVPIDWRTTDFLFVLPAVGACVGKAAGGFIADVVGARKTGTITLLASVPFIVFGYSFPLTCLIGVLLFNMSMSITLCAVATKLPRNPGLAFGLTTLGLLCGNTLTFFFAPARQTALFLIGTLVVISAGCIYFALLHSKGGLGNEKTVY